MADVKIIDPLTSKNPVVTDDTRRLIQKLIKRDPKLTAALVDCRCIEDVLENRVLKAASSINLESKFLQGTTIDDLSKENITITEMYSGGSRAHQLKYLPKGRLEAMEEYTQRIQMTPWLPKTPGLMNDRQGAIFSSPPTLKGDAAEDFEDFWKSATADGDSGIEFCSKISKLFQADGYCAIFVNKSLLPEDIESGAEVSQLEKEEKNLDAPQLVLYEAEQILWYECDSKGLKWIKTIESKTQRDDWDSEDQKIEIVRVFDRVNIRTWTITNRETVDGPVTVPHGFKSGVPVVLASPNCGASLYGSAQADIACTRLRSDLMWILFQAACPLLTYNTNKTASELEEWKRSPSRYVVLDNGKGLMEAETMAYVQLDPIGIDRLIAVIEKTENEAAVQAGQDNPGAIETPSSASGISVAWQFKTGEERTLFILTHALTHTLKKVLNLVAELLEVDEDEIDIEFNVDFSEFGSAKDETDALSEGLQIAEKYGLELLIQEMLKQWVEHNYPNIDDKNKEQILKDIESKVSDTLDSIEQDKQNQLNVQMASAQSGDENNIQNNSKNKLNVRNSKDTKDQEDK